MESGFWGGLRCLVVDMNECMVLAETEVDPFSLLFFGGDGDDD